MTRFLLFTTTRAQDRLTNLDRLRQSVRNSIGFGETFTASHYVLVQGAARAASLEPELNGRVLSTPAMLSLSQARNLLLETAGHLIGERDIVAFPDDDCYYAPDTLQQIAALFNRDGAQLVITREDHAAPKRGKSRLTPKDVVRRSTSNVIFVGGATANAVGGFDENIGLGAMLNGGEDTDYAMRAFQKARTAYYFPGAVVHHRAPGASLRSRYFPGTFAAIVANTRNDPRLVYECARKAAIGMVLAASGELKLSDLSASLRHAGKGLARLPSTPRAEPVPGVA